jgi:fructoselysine-6-P-deglycase FrlB-like protein
MEHHNGVSRGKRQNTTHKSTIAIQRRHVNASNAILTAKGSSNQPIRYEKKQQSQGYEKRPETKGITPTKPIHNRAKDGQKATQRCIYRQEEKRWKRRKKNY